MAIFVEDEFKVRRSRGNNDGKRLSGRQKHASKSAFNHKTKQGSAHSKSNEVTLKITGSGKTARGVKNGIDYLTRDGDISAYCYDGAGLDYENSGQDFNRLMTQIMTENNDYHKQYKGESVAHVKNMVFSPPPMENVNKEDALSSVKETLKKHYPNHAFVAVYHDDKEDHPHVHVNFKLRDEHTGKRLDLKKADLKTLRTGFCQSLTERGYDVSATYKHDIHHEREHQNTERQRHLYRVVKFGETAYQNRDGAKRTPYITYETLKSGKQVTIWGQGLKPYFESEKLESGAVVKIKKLEPTLVRSPLLNDDGSVSGYRETKRNNWQIENQAVERERQYDFPKSITLSPKADQLHRKQEHERRLAPERERSRTGYRLERGFDVGY